MTLRHVNYLDDTIFVGLGLVEAARIAVANPDLHIMGELPALPDNIDALVQAAQTTGCSVSVRLRGDLTPRLIGACKQAGLFTMSLPTNNERTLAGLIHSGVNFIETGRPDITAMLLPAGESEPHQNPDDAILMFHGKRTAFREEGCAVLRKTRAEHSPCAILRASMPHKIASLYQKVAKPRLLMRKPAFTGFFCFMRTLRRRCKGG